MVSGMERLPFAELCAELVYDELAALQFMKDKGLIHQHRTCARCRQSMVLRYRKDRDDVRWRCCGKQCRKEVSVKTGTWFQGYDQPVRILLFFMRAWSEKLTSLAYCKATFDMSAKVAVKLNAPMRPVAEDWVLRNPVPGGSPGLTVEVDETLFARKKYNRDRGLPQAWVVDGVCRETGQCFLAVLQIDPPLRLSMSSKRT
uniref:ISXO2-like transposase domain-containing protein n=1 Tax=Trichuris muris TaxID=70415 RepID=A0A5S6Q4E6_TRIMR